MSSGKKNLLSSLQSCLADVQRFIVDAERRDFDAVSQEYAEKTLKEIEVLIVDCVKRAEGL